jgi:uncharacterized protein (DUF1919 family)
LSQITLELDVTASLAWPVKGHDTGLGLSIIILFIHLHNNAEMQSKWLDRETRLISTHIFVHNAKLEREREYKGLKWCYKM